MKRMRWIASITASTLILGLSAQAQDDPARARAGHAEEGRRAHAEGAQEFHLEGVDVDRLGRLADELMRADLPDDELAMVLASEIEAMGRGAPSHRAAAERGADERGAAERGAAGRGAAERDPAGRGGPAERGGVERGGPMRPPPERSEGLGRHAHDLVGKGLRGKDLAEAVRAEHRRRGEAEGHVPADLREGEGRWARDRREGDGQGEVAGREGDLRRAGVTGDRHDGEGVREGDGPREGAMARARGPHPAYDRLPKDLVDLVARLRKEQVQGRDLVARLYQEMKAMRMRRASSMGGMNREGAAAGGREGASEHEGRRGNDRGH